MMKEKDNEIILYTSKDIQRIFSLGRDKTYQLIHSRGFPVIKIVREYYIPKDNLEKWTERNIGKIHNI